MTESSLLTGFGVALVGFSTIGGKHGTTSTSFNPLHLPGVTRHNYGTPAITMEATQPDTVTAENYARVVAEVMRRDGIQLNAWGNCKYPSPQHHRFR